MFFQVHLATTEEKLQEVLANNDFDFLYSCGFSRAVSLLNLKDKESLLKTVWLHYIFFHPHTELEQLKRGFVNTLDMERLMSVYPEDLHSLLVPSASYEITSSKLSESFVIDYSDNSCNDRTKEGAIVYYWLEYFEASESIVTV